MKKILFAIFTVLMICILTFSVFAEDITTEANNGVETEETTTAEDTTTEDNLLYPDDESIDKIIALAEELKELKESNYTFGERMMQLVDSENLSSTIGTLVTVVSSIAIFVFRSIIKKDSISNSAKMVALNNNIDLLQDETSKLKSENAELKSTVERLIGVINTNTETLNQINIDTSANRDIANTAKVATIATAKMVSDAFGHSRTIDASTKSLITYDYLEVLNADKKNTEG